MQGGIHWEVVVLMGFIVNVIGLIISMLITQGLLWFRDKMI